MITLFDLQMLWLGIKHGFMRLRFALDSFRTLHII